MKIGILSLNPGHNYGGILQSYALKTVLEQMGHEVKVISKYKPLEPSFSLLNIPRYCVRCIRLLLKKGDTPVFAEYYENKKGRIAFCNKYLNMKVVKNLNEIKPGEFDAIVVGSDQVWRPKYFEPQFQTQIADAFLKFSDNWKIRRVAYAPSFGVDNWEYSDAQTEECSHLIKQFDGVSVREQTGVLMCKDYFDTDAICLCDPTILLTKKDYDNLITSDTPKPQGNLLVYCLDESTEVNKLVALVSREKKMNPFRIYSSTGVNPGVDSWLRAFRDTEFVITDSFHACVFSLIFHKPFLVIGNKDRGISRFKTLLEAFGQSDRLLIKADDYKASKEYSSLDDIDIVFENLQATAINFLTQSLKK